MTTMSSASTTHRESDARPRRVLRAPRPERHDIAASDGIALRLHRYRAGTRGPVLLAHGLGVSSRIFTVDTIETNLLEFLCAHGFDVWLLDLRTSIDLPASVQSWTADSVATQDYPAAVEYVRAATGAGEIDALVHCFGSTSLFMAVLAGLRGVRSIVCSQIATHMVVLGRMRLEAQIRLPALVRAAGVPVMSARPAEHRGPATRAYDATLRLLPLPAAERCGSTVCRRISFLYGRLYQHEQVDDATHDALPELFGAVALSSLQHLAAIARRGHLIDFSGRETYMRHLDRLALPITFIHGALNACFRPEGTAMTAEMLSAANGPALYERHVVPRYGHIDCIFGKNAATDVYPLMLRHFDRVGA